MEEDYSDAYDPIPHLNQLFSTSANLSKLGEISSHVASHKTQLSIRLAQPETFTDDEKQSWKRVQNAQQEFKQLLQEISGLESSADSTEKNITNMTSEIKTLDNAKANLIQSITILKRLQMLTTAFDQLESLLKNRQYREMSQTLPAVIELMSHFKPYRSIPQIAELSRNIADVQNRISDKIFSDFALVIEQKQPVGGESLDAIGSNLPDACVVLDSIEGSYRQNLITWYCNSQLHEYRTIFRNNDEAGSLENISRRYGYLKRMLKRHLEENAKYFIASWNITEELCKSFCTTTRDDIKTILEQSGKNIDVQLLLAALQETLEFEQYLERRFSDTRASLESPQSTFAQKPRPLKFGKAISEAFQPHLNVWIEHQDKILATKINQYKAPARPSSVENGTDPQDNPTVLPSSADLFIFYRQILTQASKLSTGAPLISLSKLFGKWLVVYSTQVLKPLMANSNNMLASRNGSSSKANLDDIRTICLVLNTADYCFNTLNQLEQRLIEQLEPQFKKSIDLDKEKGLFLEIVNLCMKSLVGNVDTSCQHSWREMLNAKWSKLDQVGDQSGYVSDLCRTIESETRLIIENLAKDLFVKMLCDKIVESCCSSFLQTVVRCRPISEISAEQMLLDLYVIKNTLLKLPSLALPSTGSASSDKSQLPQPSQQYTRHVSRSLSRIEIILKVILTQQSPPEGLIQNYFYLVQDKSTANFTKILELKGIAKSEQTRFLELFASHMKAHDSLVDDSPILRALQISNPSNPSGSNNLSSGTSTTYHQSRSPSNLGNLSNSSSSLFDQKLGAPAIFKENLEKGFERFTHGTEAPVNKINENFRNIGRLFRRDGNHSPTSRKG